MNHSSDGIVVVGASLAGLTTARALRDLGYDSPITLVGDERGLPYDRPPLSKDILTGRLSGADIGLLAPNDDALELTWRLGERATAFDPVRRSVRLTDGSQLTGEGVVIATGARARALPTPTGMAGIHTLRTLDDALALRAELATGRPRVVVIGAGFIGAEVAGSARALGLEVTVLEAAPLPLVNQLGTELALRLSALHAAHGVSLETGVGVESFVGADRVEAVRLTDGRQLAADVVVVGVGAVPNTQWLAGSGLDAEAGVRCDASGRSDAPGVVAVGDAALWLDPVSGRHHRHEHWTSATEQARLAAAALLGGAGGGSPAPQPRVPYFWSEQYDSRIQFAGQVGPSCRVSYEIDEGPFSFLAVYRSAYDGTAVAVLGMNQTRAFTRWRRQLKSAAAATSLLVSA